MGETSRLFAVGILTCEVSVPVPIVSNGDKTKLALENPSTWSDGGEYGGGGEAAPSAPIVLRTTTLFSSLNAPSVCAPGRGCATLCSPDAHSPGLYATLYAIANRGAAGDTPREPPGDGVYNVVLFCEKGLNRDVVECGVTA